MSFLSEVTPAISPANIASDYSVDFTITHAFTDESIIAGVTTVEGAHITEVHNTANAGTSSTVVLAAQFNEVRTPIKQTRNALGFTAATFTAMLEMRATMRLAVQRRPIHLL